MYVNITFKPDQLAGALPALPDKYILFVFLCSTISQTVRDITRRPHIGKEGLIFFSQMFRLQIELPHVKQKTDWDCGLACSLMVLQKVLGNKFDNTEYEEICAKKNFGSSVWTIDIASIFTEYRVDYIFCTKTLGVDPSYGQNSFYEGTFTLDETRVNRLFSLAPQLELKVDKR